jgi:hypothetical protein
MFEQDGAFADTVLLSQRRLTGADVEEIFQHLNDAETYGVDLNEEGEEVDERNYDEYEFGEFGE